MIEVTLLGPPRVERDGRPVAFDTRKALALLAYLALADRPRTRDGLADLLWPEQDIEHARGALRRTLSTLRGAIGATFVEATRNHVRLVASVEIAVDIERFRTLAAAGDLAGAADLFRGDFLEGLVIAGAPDFEDWQSTAAEDLRRELAQVLGGLALEREQAGDVTGALAVVRRWLALDELHEPAHRTLIRLSALSGDRAGALTLYRNCVRILSRELGVPPLHETTLLYESISQGRLDPPTTTAAAPRGQSDRPPLVGREGPLRALLAAHRNSADGGRVVVVEGEAGIGKTRLAEEFSDRVRADGAVVLTGRAFEEEAGLSYAAVVDAVRARLQQDRGWVPTLSATALREASRLIPELSQPGDEGGATSSGPTSKTADSHDVNDAGAATRFLAGIWSTLVAASAGSRPGVLLIDDAQWADESTLALLTYGLRRLTDERLLILLTWRSPHDHPVRRVIAELERSGRGTFLGLERLAEHDVGDLLLTAGPEASNPQLRARLHEETEGLPFLIVEYLRVLGSASDDAWDLPSGARELMRSRLDPVSETGRQILSAAAVIGRSFDLRTLRSTSGRSEQETMTALEELSGRGLIREGGLDYDFSHEKLRAMVYADTSLVRRRLLHARAAQATLDSAVLARHLQLAGDEQAAATAYLVAADQARAVFAHSEAIAHYRAALALGAPGPSAVHQAIGQIQTLQGNYADALTSYETAASTADGDRLSGIEQELGHVHHRRGEWTLAEAHFQAALANSSPDDAVERARINADLSLTAHAAGDQSTAADLARRSHTLASTAGDPRALAQAENLLGLLAVTGGDPGEAVRRLRSSLALAEQSRDEGARVAALNNLALAHRARGDLDAAVGLTRDALARCTAQGDRHREAALHNNLADLLHAKGEPEEAMQHLKQAVAIFAEIGADEGPQPAIWKLVQW